MKASTAFTIIAVILLSRAGIDAHANVQPLSPRSSNKPDSLFPSIITGELAFGIFLGIFLGLLFLLFKRKSSRSKYPYW